MSSTAGLPKLKTRRGIEAWLLILALIVAIGAYCLVGLGVKGELPGNVYVYSGWLFVLAAFGHIVVRIRAKYADPVILPIAVFLNGIGLAMIYRLDLANHRTGMASVATKQLIWTSLGLVILALIVILLKDHRRLRRYTYLSGLAGIVLLLLPLAPVIGTTINGARIWIHVGPMSFQPGEIAKLLLAFFFAGYLVSNRDALSLAGPKILGLQLPRIRDMAPLVIAWLASLGVLVFQRDLGTSLLFFGLFIAMLYVATERISWIVIGLILFAGGAVLAGAMISHVGQRLNIWLHALDPSVYNQTYGGSYQLVQGLFGLANGGLTGTGLGLGRPDIVPHADSDFIITSLGEELGLVGLFAILLVYVIFVERGIRIAIAVRDGFGKLLSAGLCFTIGLQCFIVVGGVTRVIPLTGLTTPFLAAGGSSLLANWIIVALLLRISDNARRPLDEFATGVLSVLPDDERQHKRGESGPTEAVSS